MRLRTKGIPQRIPQSHLHGLRYRPAVMRRPRRREGILNQASAVLPGEFRLSDAQSHQSCRDALYPHGAYPRDYPTHTVELAV